MLATNLHHLNPDAVDALSGVHAVVWDTTVDPVTLELCRLRMAALLDDRRAASWRAPRALEAGLDEARVEALEDWERSQLFSERERAHLAFTEQFVTYVAGISDADVDALLAHAEPMEVYGFISALYVLEFSQRLQMVTSTVLAEVGDAA